jgi:hypothetical protein
LWTPAARPRPPANRAATRAAPTGKHQRSRTAIFDSHCEFLHAWLCLLPLSRFTAWASLCSAHPTKKTKGSGTPADADPTAATVAAARARRRSAHAYRRSTAALAKESLSSPRRNPGQSFRRLGRSAASYGPPSGEDRCASPRALPAPSCHRPASTSRAGPSAGRLMPGPPGNGPYLPVRRHRTRSAFRNTFAKGVLRSSEI